MSLADGSEDTIASSTEFNRMLVVAAELPGVALTGAVVEGQKGLQGKSLYRN